MEVDIIKRIATEVYFRRLLGGQSIDIGKYIGLSRRDGRNNCYR
jgi:hypothetical protein